MIQAAHFRRGGGDREPIRAAGELTSIAAKFTPSQATWGKVTSREPTPGTKAALDLVAFRLGVKPATLRRAIELGVFNG